MKLTESQLNFLRKTPEHDAYYTGDIAYDAGHSTAQAYTALKALEAKGMVESVSRGASGMAVSWRRTQAGTAALQSQEPKQ